jgi:hypothetical protein
MKMTRHKKTPHSGVFLCALGTGQGRFVQLLGSRSVGSWSSGRSVSSWSGSFSSRSSHRSGRCSSFFFFTASSQSSSSDHGGQNEGLVHDDFPYGLKQFPETASRTETAIKTETKALELFCAQSQIIALSLDPHQTDMKPSVTKEPREDTQRVFNQPADIQSSSASTAASLSRDSWLAGRCRSSAS